MDGKWEGKRGKGRGNGRERKEEEKGNERNLEFSTSSMLLRPLTFTFKSLASSQLAAGLARPTGEAYSTPHILWVDYCLFNA